MPIQPKLTKNLKKSAEDLKDKLLSYQNAEKAFNDLRVKFVSETNPKKKEAMKPQLISASKIKNQAKLEADAADVKFHKMLDDEPGDIYDLLDHKIQEHILRKAIRNIIKEIKS